MSLADVSVQRPIVLVDTSEYRPEVKDPSLFRDFRIHKTPAHVMQTYDEMHTNQTLAFVKDRLEFWGCLNHGKFTMMEAAEKLNDLVDQSDPDIDLPNSYHAFQTAEGIRKKYPDNEWLQVTGFIHDLGKLMALWGEPQWAVVGDTFPVGCAPDPSIVFGVESFKNNPDLLDEKLNTRLGIYKENCGLDKVYMSWGHDEYLYRVLCESKHNLPDESLFIIRFHSFYPWHTCDAYNYLCDNKDMEMLKWVRLFNKFDLYTKAPELPDVDSLHDYYEGLMRKFVPGKICW